MYKLTLTAAVAACFLSATPVHAADVAAGKALAEDGCVDCHGDDGKGDEDNPAIDGWTVDKFVKAMKEYQDGTRTKSQKMTKAAKKLDDKQIADLAAYYATLK
jgi:cytochrome c553